MKDLVKIIQQVCLHFIPNLYIEIQIDYLWNFYKESYNYRDPITELVECLYVNFDFDGAQVKLRKCDQVKKLQKLFSFVLFKVIRYKMKIKK